MKEAHKYTLCNKSSLSVSVHLKLRHFPQFCIKRAIGSRLSLMEDGSVAMSHLSRSKVSCNLQKDEEVAKKLFIYFYFF